MIRALTTAATGLEAQSAHIENISNDIANANTDGYKRSNTEFHDLMYETIKMPGGSLGANSQSPVGIQTGMGVKVGAAHKIFEQGPARMTYHPYDLMIEGKGFFPVQMPNTNEIAYTRSGAFHMDAQGKLQMANGAKLIPEVNIPPTALNITVSGSGEIRAAIPNGGETTIGQIQLITFQNEQGLEAKGDSLYLPTLASGTPLQGVPGENGLGLIQQGALEGSNVSIANSMIDMIKANRMFEANSKAIQTVSEMMGQTANLK